MKSSTHQELHREVWITSHTCMHQLIYCKTALHHWLGVHYFHSRQKHFELLMFFAACTIPIVDKKLFQKVSCLRYKQLQVCPIMQMVKGRNARNVPFIRHFRWKDYNKILRDEVVQPNCPFELQTPLITVCFVRTGDKATKEIDVVKLRFTTLC